MTRELAVGDRARPIPRNDGPQDLQHAGVWSVDMDLTADCRAGKRGRIRGAGFTQLKILFGYFRAWGNNLQVNQGPPGMWIGEPPDIGIPDSRSKLRYVVTAADPSSGYTVGESLNGGSVRYFDLEAPWPVEFPISLADENVDLAGEYISRISVDLTERTEGHLLWYDGVFLSYVDLVSKTVVRQWRAFSGAAGMNASAASQREPSKGPLPSGLYRMNPYDTVSQSKADTSWDWIKWTLKSPAWGSYATELEPQTTDTYGRHSFYVHGGSRPGSAGCITSSKGIGSFINGSEANWRGRQETAISICHSSLRATG